MSSESDATLAQVFDFNLDIARAANIFAYYVGALFFLAYFLSLFVSSLHTRQDSVVYPLTRPHLGQDFSEYIIVARTSLLCGSSFDTRGRIMITLKGSFDESPPLHLKKGKGIECFLERGSTNIFVYHSYTNLGDIEEIEVKLINDAPYEIPYIQWRPSFITIMKPLTREEWGTTGLGRMVCPGVLSEAMQCIKNKRERFGVIKSVCMFHPLLSLFNSPVRFGMYNNMVNAIFIFFLYSLLITSVLIVELALNLNKVRGLTYNIFYKNPMLRALACALLTWLVEIVLETVVRNVVPRVSAVRYAAFRGLMEPINTRHALRDFSINLDWDSVRPILLNKYVTLVHGTLHFSAHSVFPVSHSLRILNLWGYFTLTEAREAELFSRTMNSCALPLPATLRWLGREASSLKDDILNTQIESNFTSPMCFFCCWLRDWPVNFIDEPWQNGLVLSHIMARDIISLMRMSVRSNRARKAQICMHQWYGLICCLFLQALKQDIYIKSDSTSQINAFIQRTVTQFGKRSAREIQSTWRARQNRIKASPLKQWTSDYHDSATGLSAPKEDSGKHNVNDVKGWGSLWSSAPWASAPPTLPPTYHSDWGFSAADYQEDELRFDDLSTLMYEENIKDEFNLRMQAGDLVSQVSRETVALSTVSAASSESSVAEKSPSSRPATYVARRRRARSSLSKLRHRKASGKTQLSSPSAPGELATRGGGGGGSNAGGIFSRRRRGRTTTVTTTTTTQGQRQRVDSATTYGRTGSSPLNTNANALEMGEDEKKRLKEERDRQILMLLQQKRIEKTEDNDGNVYMRLTSPISGFEEFSLGPPYDTSVERTRDSTSHHLYRRHKDELSGYNCGAKQCLAFADIHKMVGNSCMYILKRILQDLLFFALDSPTIKLRDKMWLRKRMVIRLFDDMDVKSKFYEDSMFKESGLSERENYACNMALTTNLILLELMLDIACRNKEVSDAEDLDRRRKLYTISRNPQPRCLFCAKRIKAAVSDPRDGCYDFEKLVKFFTRETIYVAEKEVNAELQHKITLQRFCAGIMNLAVREMLMELEDPPMVLSTKVTRALLYKMLEVKSPKAHTDFREMTADELRRVGTRRERIQARHDATIGRAKKDTQKQKKEKAINSFLVETLSSKWRVASKENALQYCAKLLAQCLVQEKILGFSIYSGFISKEHELLLEGSKAHLIEVEKKATKAVLKIGNSMLEQRLDIALSERDYIDVVFNKTSVEAGYTLEAVSVMQVLLEPMFLKTCCFYINDIVERKIAEFIEFFNYIGNFDPLRQYTSIKKLMKESRIKYASDKPIVEHSVADHGSISTPVLRWGVDAIKGVAPLPEDLKVLLIYEDSEELLAKALAIGLARDPLEALVSLLLKTRRKARRAMEVRETEDLKKLQLHLARVQARLTEQVALASQSASDSSAVETDFQRDYHRDELYNVELYACRDLQRPLSTAAGFLILFLLVLATLVLMLFTTFRASNMELSHAKVWFIACGYSALMYTFVLQPVKCALYSIMRLYRM